MSTLPISQIEWQVELDLCRSVLDDGINGSDSLAISSLTRDTFNEAVALLGHIDTQRHLISYKKTVRT